MTDWHAEALRLRKELRRAHESRDYWKSRFKATQTRTQSVRADGYILENEGYQHRRVAAEALGRPLRLGEHVHHINGVPTDNRPENLVVVSAREHSILTAGIATDNEVIRLLLLGYSRATLMRKHVSSHRIARLRKHLDLPKLPPKTHAARMRSLASWQRDRRAA